jgi:hypothetical protein
MDVSEATLQEKASPPEWKIMFGGMIAFDQCRGILVERILSELQNQALYPHSHFSFSTFLLFFAFLSCIFKCQL